MLKRTDNALPPLNQATRKPTRREQRKLDQQAQAEREGRRLAKNRARQKRYRIRMKAKAKAKPKKPRITMAIRARERGISRMTLWRHGRRATEFRKPRPSETETGVFYAA